MLTEVPPRPNRQPHLDRIRAPGLTMTVMSLPTHREFHLTLQPLPEESIFDFFGRLHGAIAEHGGTIIKQEIFGSLIARNKALCVLQHLFGDSEWPITWVEGESCGSGDLAGTHVFAVAGTPVENVTLKNRIVGRMFSDGFVNHCLFGDIQPSDISRSAADQSWQVFKNLEAALNGAGMEMSNLVRTWLFLDDILSWYGPFNIVRKEFFRQRHLFGGLIPASTGVSGKNAASAALVAAGWAVQPLKHNVTIRELGSPLQCPAPAYGSCFSRAVEIVTPAHRRVLVSGTASIDASGHSVRFGSIKGQIKKTMDVVEAMLSPRNLTFGDTNRATAYFKHAKDTPAFANWSAEQELQLPLINTEADICRDELLFEIELDALALLPATPKADGRKK